MHQEDELLSDVRIVRIREDYQTNLVAHQCSGTEKRIRAAHSMTEAERIAEETCGKFSNDCSSSLLRGALIRRTSEILKKHWGSIITL
jgi:hypothetical protein